MNPSKRLCFLPQRYIMAIMIFLGVTCCFLMRTVFNTAIKHISAPKKSQTKTNISYCEGVAATTAAPVKKMFEEKYDFKPKKMADAFFTGYMISHIPAGVISDLFGGKYVLGGATIAAALLSCITPTVIRKSDENYIAVLFLRGTLGVALGAVFPASNSLLSCWSPPEDVGKLSGIVFAGTQIATVLNNIASNKVILENRSWSSVFYIYAGLGFVFCVFWQIFFYSNPTKSPWVDKKEFSYLERQLAGYVTYTRKSIPWRAMLTSIPVWALVIAQFGHTWIWHVLLVDLPKYLNNVLQFNIMKSGYMSSLSYLLMSVFTVTLGFLSDFFINHDYVHVTTARKMLTTFGAMGPGIFILSASYAGCRRTVTIVNFTFGMGLMGCYYAGTRVNTLDLAPNYSGIIMALANGLGALSGIIVPYVQELVAPNGTMEEWTYVFWIHLLVLALSNIVFIVFGTGEEQKWNRQQEDLSEILELEI